MFPSGYFSIPYSVTGVGISDPGTAPLVGDQSQIVDSDRTRLKRLRPGSNVTLSSTDDAITISSLGGGGTSIALSDPVSAALPGDVSLRLDDHTVKRLRPSSSRITCTSLPDCIALDVVDVDLALSSSGTGTTLVKSDHVLKDLKGGTNIELVNTGDDVTIKNTYTFTETPITTSGTGYTLKKSDHVLKDLKAGTNIALDITENDVTVRNTYAFTQTPTTSSGVGNSLIKNDHQFKGLSNGTNINIVSGNDDLVINSTFTETATSSVGTGVSLQKASHVFKSLVEGTNVTIANNGTDEIKISTPSLATASANGTSLVGTTPHTVKSLVGDPGITVALDGADDQMVRLAPVYPTLTSTGTGTGILAHGVTKLGVKTLTQGTNVSVTNAADTVTLASTATTSVGTGTAIMKADHIFRSLVPGTNVTINNTDDEVTLNSKATSSVGTGVSLQKSDHVFKSLKTTPPTACTITYTLDDINIDSPILTSTHTTGTSVDYSLLTGVEHQIRGIRCFDSSLLGGNVIVIGKNFPKPAVFYDPVVNSLCAQDTGTVRNIPSGQTCKELTPQCMPYKQAGFGILTFDTKLPYGIHLASKSPCIACTVPSSPGAYFATTELEPWPSGYWMICSVAMQYRTPTHLFQKGGTTGYPRIALGRPSGATNWRVTVSLNAYNPGMYWDVQALEGVTDSNRWTYMITYTSNQIKVRMQNGALITSPLFGETGWVAEPSGALFSSIPLVTRNIFDGDKYTTKSGMNGSTWSMFSDPNDPNHFQQSYYLFNIYFYPEMTDEQANAAFTYHDRFRNY